MSQQSSQSRAKARALSEEKARRWTILRIAFLTTTLALAVIAYATGALAAGSFSGDGLSESSSSEDKPKGATDTKAYKEAVKLINQEQYEDAIAKLLDVNAAEPNDPDVLNYLGYAHRQLDKNEMALAYYEQALAVQPKHKGANEYLGELYLKMGELEKAEAQLAKLDDICTFGCSEYRELEAKITAYKAANGAS